MSETQNSFVKKHPQLVAIALVLGGLILMLLGYFAYGHIIDLERTGASWSLPRFLWFIYEIAGVWGVVAAFELFGLGLLYQAYKTYKGEE